MRRIALVGTVAAFVLAACGGKETTPSLFGVTNQEAVQLIRSCDVASIIISRNSETVQLTLANRTADFEAGTAVYIIGPNVGALSDAFRAASKRCADVRPEPPASPGTPVFASFGAS